MERLQALYGDWFSQIFRSITTDNGNEFAAFSAFEALGSDIHCADLLFAAGIGVLPGKHLCCRTPEELFEEQLDRIYVAK